MSDPRESHTGEERTSVVGVCAQRCRVDEEQGEDVQQDGRHAEQAGQSEDQG